MTLILRRVFLAATVIFVVGCAAPVADTSDSASSAAKECVPTVGSRFCPKS
jgi:hypothetical protein